MGSQAQIEGTCPNGGLWYTCAAQTPAFFGCCTSNPCNGVGCPTSDLRAAGLGVGSGPDFSTNDSSFWPNVECTKGLWWTCATQNPTFQGCCGSNPCGGKGCPGSELYPADFGTVPAYLMPLTVAATRAAPAPTVILASGTSFSTTATAGSQETSTVSSSASSPSGTSFSATATAQSQETSAAPPSASSSSVPAIAGGVAGGVAFLILVGIIIWLYRRLSRQKARNDTALEFSGGFYSQPEKQFSSSGNGESSSTLTLNQPCLRNS